MDLYKDTENDECLGEEGINENGGEEREMTRQCLTPVHSGRDEAFLETISEH